MGFIHDRRLVFSDKDIIKSLIADLAMTGEPVSVRAKELPEDAYASVVEVSEKTFVVYPLVPLHTKLYVPLSSWRFDVNLTGAHLSFTTMSLSRESETRILMSLPELLVSGNGRDSYRISVVGEPVRIMMQSEFGVTKCGLLDASFGGGRLKSYEHFDQRLDVGSPVTLFGEHRDIEFQRTGIVGWLQDNHIGIGIPGMSETTSVDDPWQTFVRSLAYDHVMARIQSAA